MKNSAGPALCGLGLVGLLFAGSLLTPRQVDAAGGVVPGPNVVAPDRYVYYPGTEVLAEDEVRFVACGTGMPDQRRGQASTCFLFEFGNGEKMNLVFSGH